MSNEVTRRTLLAAAGATAVAVGTGMNVASAAPGASPAPTNGSSPFLGGGTPGVNASAVLAPAALTAGLSYVTVDGLSFFPANPMAMPRAIGIVGVTTTAGNVLLAPLLLPTGAVLKEVQVFYEAPAAPPPQFGVFKKRVTSGYAPLAPPTNLTVSIGVQTTTLTFTEPIDGTATYIGDFVVNAAGHVIAALLVGYLAPPQAFVPISPITRVLDTRTTGGKLLPNDERTIDLHIPSFARAAVINLTVTDTVAAGFVAVFPADIPYPGNSSINWSASNQNIANGVITATDTTGRIKIRGGVNPTDVVIDVQGFLL